MSAEASLILDKIKSEKDIVEKIKLLRKLIREHNIPIKDIASNLKVKSSYICHLNRLNRLPDVIFDGYYSKDIYLSHLFIISRLKKQEEMLKVYEAVLADNLSVGKTESLVREIIYGIKTKGEYMSSDDRNKFTDTLQSLKKNIRATIIQTRIKAKIILEIKGSLEKTSKTLGSLTKHIESWKE